MTCRRLGQRSEKEGKLKNEKKLLAVTLIVMAGSLVWLAIVNHTPEQAKYQPNCDTRITGGAYICR